jgi:hypothetical protein
VFIRERIAWCLVAVLALACTGSEWAREETQRELAHVQAKYQTLSERVEEHNKKAIDKVINKALDELFREENK